MDIDDLIAREEEIAEFDSIMRKNEPAFIAVYGRRRIGKTYLITKYFKTKGLFFHVTGVRNARLKRQLSNFIYEYSDHFCKGENVELPADWFEAFQMLRKEIVLLPKKQKVILFFDELPWLATARSEFLPALEYLWNRYLFDRSNIILIVCGSAASWMIDNVINNKAGLHGRITREFRLLPFTLGETERYLKARQVTLDRKQIAEISMCIGGVAKYLNYIEKGRSAIQNINDICFSTNGPLISEFHKLYRSLFDYHEDHIQIVRALSAKRCGLTYSEIVQKTSLSTGGTLTKRIQELIQSGFVSLTPSFGQAATANRYVLVDEYSLFYLKWIDNVPALDLQTHKSDYWLKRRNSQSWRSWAGHAFEAICLKHISKIKTALGIAALHTVSAKWQHTPEKGFDDKGAKIDIIIDRADQCINLCEVKFYNEPLRIDKSIVEKLEYQRQCFERISNTRKSTFITLISPYGVHENDYSKMYIDNIISIDDLF